MLFMLHPLKRHGILVMVKATIRAKDGMRMAQRARPRR
jgi:hypothetical protein